jgi:hypothetical protein
MTDDPPPAREPRAAPDLTTHELELAALVIRCSSMTTVNFALVEGMKAGTWFQVGGCLSSAVAGGAIFNLFSQVAPPLTWVVVGGGGIVAAALCLAGAAWHRRRAVTLFGEARQDDQARDAIIAELVRRGLADG